MDDWILWSRLYSCFAIYIVPNYTKFQIDGTTLTRLKLLKQKELFKMDDILISGYNKTLSIENYWIPINVSALLWLYEKLTQFA